ncbi:hypothetical protein Tsp_10233 [Trichinella spiralis]|uniref:hypothetical protein n=1 Tax=Trichinella spiralis TaxID=6334 RepID=UPI0001EFDFA5|nr:hypothetical protein Tsp_10233 [Trichinella spiralis]
MMGDVMLPSFLYNSNCFPTCCFRIDRSAIEMQCPENSLTLNDGHLRKCQEQFKSFLPQAVTLLLHQSQCDMLFILYTYSCTTVQNVLSVNTFNLCYYALTHQQLGCSPKPNFLYYHAILQNVPFVMLQTHKYHINTAITGACIKQPFIILYMLEFILMLKASK